MVKSALSLYFHIPFCHRKCPYCHFYVTANKQENKGALYEALCLEWQRLLSKVQDYEIVSLYFGGGTPSLFGPFFIGSITELIKKTSHVAKDCEITLEANPEDVTLDLMRDYQKAGINRVSVGVQSLQDHALLTLGRTHNAIRAVDAIHMTHEAGITNISIDLMFELPNQSLDDFAYTLSQLKSLPIQHLSLYNLTIEPGTAFFKKTLSFPPQEECLKMLKMATFKLEKLGLKRYEISAFSLPGYESRHNLGYWTARPFLGLGPSAFSYFEGKRFRNVCHLTKYCQALKENASPVDFVEKLPYPDNVHELLAVRLRLLEGAPIQKFTLPQATLNRLEKLRLEGFLQMKDQTYQLTEKGLLFYDTVASELI